MPFHKKTSLQNHFGKSHRVSCSYYLFSFFHRKIESLSKHSPPHNTVTLVLFNEFRSSTLSVTLFKTAEMIVRFCAMFVVVDSVLTTPSPRVPFVTKPQSPSESVPTLFKRDGDDYNTDCWARKLEIKFRMECSHSDLKNKTIDSFIIIELLCILRNFINQAAS